MAYIFTFGSEKKNNNVGIDNITLISFRQEE